jgi:PAS domain S-box-containing protein
VRRRLHGIEIDKDAAGRKQSQGELRRAHAEAERLLACMSSFLIGVDKDTCVTRWNAAAQKAFGLRDDQVIGKRLDECAIQWDFGSITKEAPGWPSIVDVVRLPEIRYTRPDGIERFLGITINPIQNEAGDPDGFFLIGVDITERRNLEMRLMQAQKLESIGYLAAGIAHEINTPTQYIGDNIEFLRETFLGLRQLIGKYTDLLEAVKLGVVDLSLVEELESTAANLGLDYLMAQIPRALEQSIDGISRVAKIVRAMKEFSHPGGQEKTSIDINRAIESTITVARNEWKHVAEVVTHFDWSLPCVACLPGEFNQVILNILVNAAHAIHDAIPKGSLQKGTITVSTRRDGEWAEVRIRDTGTGIPEEARPRIFDPFFTTKEVGKGTGQGLAIAHNVIVGKHGGTLTFETEMGKGATFIIRLPILAGGPSR